MCEYSWWYLYVQVLNEDAQKKSAINKLVESLLPWVNPEMWQEYQKQKDKGRENIAFDDQMRSMLQGTFSTDPDVASVLNIDQFEVSDAARQRVNQQRDGSVGQMFDQQRQGGSMKDQLFPGQGPTFRGRPGDMPPAYKDFYKNAPNPEDFPPEKPPEDNS